MDLSSLTKRYLKKYHILYDVYFFLGAFLVRCIKPFLKADPYLILFVSAGGKKFGDSPKVLYDAMKNDIRFNRFRFVWAFINPKSFDLENDNKIKIDTLEYYKYALKARVWITDVNISRGLSFSGIHTLYLNTWHGTPIKKIGLDAQSQSSLSSRRINKIADIMLAQSEYEVDVYSKAFNLDKENIIITGLPRNDELTKKNNPEALNMIKDKLLLSQKKVILYAPTFRDYEQLDNKTIEIPINFKKWEDIFSEKYVLIVRFHPAVSKLVTINENHFVRDMSTYPNLNELLLISDILISDYSSIFMDFSILEKPMLCYSYDYNRYSISRGMYFDIRKHIDYANNEVELIDKIINIESNVLVKNTISFKDRFVQSSGNATANVLNLLYNKLKTN